MLACCLAVQVRQAHAQRAAAASLLAWFLCTAVHPLAPPATGPRTTHAATLSRRLTDSHKLPHQPTLAGPAGGATGGGRRRRARRPRAPRLFLRLPHGRAAGGCGGGFRLLRHGEWVFGEGWVFWRCDLVAVCCAFDRLVGAVVMGGRGGGARLLLACLHLHAFVQGRRQDGWAEAVRRLTAAFAASSAELCHP